jgi:regulatory protein
MTFSQKNPLTPEQALAYALRLLNQRDYSQANLKRKIIDRGGLPDEANTIVAKCVALGLVNDERLAERITKHESQWRHQSQQSISAKLLKKGIPKDLIGSALAQTKDAEITSAQHQATLWLAKHQTLEQHEQRQKLMAFLYRKGFSSSSISRAIQALRDD